MGKTFNMTGGSGGGGGGISLSSIAVTTPPTKTSYTDGESFDPTGMVITATYSNGATRAVTGYTVSPSALTEGTTSVTISYTEDGVTKTTTQAVSVGSFTLDVTLPAAAGTTVTATDGVTTLTETTVAGSGGNSTATFSIPTTGTWTVSAGWQYSSETVNVVSGTSEYSVTLSKLYAELEYVSLPGNKWVDADFLYDQYYDFEGKMQIDSIGNGSGASSWPSLFGVVSRTNDDPTSYIGFFADYRGSATITCGSKQARKSMSVTAGLILIGEARNLNGNSPVIKVNEESLSITSTTMGLESSRSIFVGTTNDESGSTALMTESLIGKIFYLIIYALDGVTPILNFVPAKNSSSQVGFYDTARNRFFYNANFTAGPEV